MAGPSGMASAWFERVSKYGENSVTRLNKAQLEIRQGQYEFKHLLKDVLNWSEDTMNLWMPLAGSSIVPAAVVVVKQDQIEGVMQPLDVIPPDHGKPTPTDLSDNNGNVIPASQVDVSWHNGQRGRLALRLINLQPNPPAVGYYTGAVFVGKELIATVHVRVDPK